MHPTIEPNSLSTQKDLKDVVAGGRLLQALVGTSSMQGLIEAPIGPSVVDLDDASLIEDFRKRAATVFHPCGTCGMGESPEASVVDPKLKVFGVKGLRVADASVFPSITSGNTNAPAIMVGFRAGELILEDR